MRLIKYIKRYLAAATDERLARAAFWDRCTPEAPDQASPALVRTLATPEVAQADKKNAANYAQAAKNLEQLTKDPDPPPYWPPGMPYCPDREAEGVLENRNPMKLVCHAHGDPVPIDIACPGAPQPKGDPQ